MKLGDLKQGMTVQLRPDDTIALPKAGAFRVGTVISTHWQQHPLAATTITMPTGGPRTVNGYSVGGGRLVAVHVTAHYPSNPTRDPEPDDALVFVQGSAIWGLWTPDVADRVLAERAAAAEHLAAELARHDTIRANLADRLPLDQLPAWVGLRFDEGRITLDHLDALIAATPVPVVVKAQVLPGRLDPSAEAHFANWTRAETYASTILPDYQAVILYVDGVEQGRLERP